MAAMWSQATVLPWLLRDRAEVFRARQRQYRLHQIFWWGDRFTRSDIEEGHQARNLARKFSIGFDELISKNKSRVVFTHASQFIRHGEIFS